MMSEPAPPAAPPPPPPRYLGMSESSRRRLVRRMSWPKVITDADCEAVRSGFDFSSPPHPSIAHVDWDSVTGVFSSSGGSVGVTFISTPAGAVVIKASATAGSQTFSSLLARRMNLRAPRVRILLKRSPEGERLFAALKRFDSGQRTLPGLFARAFVMVMEYVQLRTLEDLSAADMERLLGPRDAPHGHGALVLHDLGYLAGFDMLVNNTDRMPLIAKNNGNPGNVMFSRTSGDVISLDNDMVGISPVAHREAFLRYVEEVATLIRTIEMEPDVPCDGVRKIGACIERFTGYVVGEAGLVCVQRGVRDAVAKVHEDERSLEVLVQIEKNVLSRIVNTHALKDIDEVYLGTLLEVYKAKGQLPEGAWTVAMHVADFIDSFHSELEKKVADAHSQHVHTADVEATYKTKLYRSMWRRAISWAIARNRAVRYVNGLLTGRARVSLQGIHLVVERLNRVQPPIHFLRRISSENNAGAAAHIALPLAEQSAMLRQSSAR